MHYHWVLVIFIISCIYCHCSFQSSLWMGTSWDRCHDRLVLTWVKLEISKSNLVKAFTSACSNSLLVSLPGILVTECLDQQLGLALSTFSHGPHTVTSGCFLLLSPISIALVGSTGSTSKPGMAHCPQYCSAGKGRNEVGQLVV